MVADDLRRRRNSLARDVLATRVARDSRGRMACGALHAGLPSVLWKEQGVYVSSTDVGRIRE